MNTFDRLAKYMGGYTGLILLSMVCSFVIAIGDLGYIQVLASTIDALKSIETHTFDEKPLIIKFFKVNRIFNGIPFAIADQQVALHLIGYVLGGAFCLVLVKGIFSYFNSFLMDLVGLKLITRLRNEVYEKIVFAPIGILKDHRSGDLITRMTDDVRSLHRAIGSTSSVIRAIIYLPVFIVAMLISSFKLTILVLLIFPPLVHLINQFGKRIRAASGEIQQHTADLSSQLKETIYGTQIIKSFTTEVFERDKFLDTTKHQYNTTIKRIRLTSLLGPLVELISAIGVVVVFGLGCRQVILGNLGTGEFIGYVAMISLMFKPIRTISQFNTVLQQSLASADRVFHVLDFKDERLEQQKEPNLPPIRGEIEFRNVSFTYNDQEKVVDSISFCIESGKIIALVGPSGHGKTTLLNLILRFYEATLGEILIDGFRIRDFSLGSLRRQIAIVPQETILFSGTIRANVAYGKADITDSDILKATKLANAHDFIVDLPNGYETEVGESGLMLSGGERQRISIARAIAKNPRILLLDEATSSLDSESESLIQQSLSYLMKGQTTFVIAHRLSTIINADEIFVLNKGKITERGTHQKLIRENGLYQKLTEIQFR